MHERRLANPNAACPRVKQKNLNAMVAAAWDAGWWCEKTSKSHVMCYPPDGGRMVLVANTPSDRRTIPNTRSALRLSGLDI
jgi:hypothetical protein